MPAAFQHRLVTVHCGHPAQQSPAPTLLQLNDKLGCANACLRHLERVVDILQALANHSRRRKTLQLPTLSAGVTKSLNTGATTSLSAKIIPVWTDDGTPSIGGGCV
jgi:hypothetical protein